MNNANAVKLLQNHADPTTAIIYRRYKDKWDNHIYLTVGHMLPDEEYKSVPKEYRNQPFYRQFNDDGEYLGGSFELHPEFMAGNNWKLLEGKQTFTPFGTGICFRVPFKTKEISGSVFVNA